MWLVSAWPVGGSLPFELKPGEFTIGRGKTSDIVVCDSSISKTHARLHVGKSGDMRIEDLGSRNGIDVDGKNTSSSSVRLHDRIRLGAVPCLITPEPLPASLFSDHDDSAFSFVKTPPKKKIVRIDAAFSPRKREVLELLAKGLSEDEIANQTGRSYHTVHNHVRVIYRLLGVHTRGECLAKVNGKK